MFFYIDDALLPKYMGKEGGQKMFLVTDLTGKVPHTTKINDAKTVRDIIVGITGEQKAGDAIFGIVGYMNFGDEFICQPRFKVKCVKDVEAEIPIAKSIAMTAARLLATSSDDYASRIWSRIEDMVIADVLECTDDCEDGFTDGDVALSIGRAIAKQFGFEV